jgi:hypothetical protein
MFKSKMREIYRDEFWKQLQLWSKKFAPCTILEIGGGTGDGSTTSFFEAVALGSRVFSIEGRKDRYEKLRKKPVIALYGCSVAAEDYMSEQEVIDFYHATQTKLNDNSLETVLGWRKEELETLAKLPHSLVRDITADFVFIDGSPFSGEKEFHYSVEINNRAKVVALDDTNDIKNLSNYLKLKASNNWEMVWEDFSLRNGAAIFVKK